MTAYADPELLIAEWLSAVTELKIWTEPRWQGNERFLSAVALLQRAPGRDDLALTLDEATLDVDVYAANPEHARTAANDIWSAMTFQLPRTTFANGVFVKAVRASPPHWAPDPKVYRRTATYRVMLHGVI